MGKNKYMLFVLVVVSNCLFAQVNQEKYIVYFKDKSHTQDIMQQFSEKALAKRQKFNIQFDERDYPVNNLYTDQLKNEQITILNTSSWLNAVIVLADEKKMSAIKQMSFVASVTKINNNKLQEGIASIEEIDECSDLYGIQTFEDNYTYSFSQFHLLKGEYLHEQGFNGENMTIAICDNGFYNANNNKVFDHIFSDKRLLGTYDYVDGDSLVFNDNAGKHGAACLSFIGGIKSIGGARPDQYIGTAVKSNFYLFHTEDNRGERLQEEFNLAAALERCTQLGVDVVSISLGYNTFDVLSENHDTSDMHKNNTPAAKAVNIASSKGILVCVAAGNQAGWQYIMTPSDADSAFCIASVDVNGVVAPSSSIGLPGDPRIKPNVAAAGQSVYFLNDAGNIAVGSGTSFATPSLAGMAACLWQAYPNKSNWEIKTAIEQSASQYLTPDKKIGYGIPDFQKAYNLLATPTFVTNKSLENEISVYPNPFQSGLNIVCQSNLRVENILVMNNVGQTIYSVNRPAENTLALNDLPKGMYLLQIETDKGMLIKKIIKD